ncbi:sulfatase 1 [Elysia marginata]|uniref:Sulfatase 1 n=1 Tax=Elysia marginata TaxID=1093978 RepID=A0AAV4I960_9GAST|nr:sulfatase 1 [Elysia marginata]
MASHNLCQIHTGLQHEIIYSTQANGLPLDSPTLADKLKESGYSTHMVGKWHLGFYKHEYMPHYRGFDTFYGMLLGHGDHFTHSTGRRRNVFLDLRFNDEPIRNETGHYSTHLFTQKSIDVIKAHDKSKILGTIDFMHYGHDSFEMAPPPFISDGW